MLGNQSYIRLLIRKGGSSDRTWASGWLLLGSEKEKRAKEGGNRGAKG